jgi:hypothetical protein
LLEDSKLHRSFNLDPSATAGPTDCYLPLLKNYRNFADAFG